jgi:hypothetical protein
MHRILSVLSLITLISIGPIFADGHANSEEIPFEVKRIWNDAPHNAFTDILRWKGDFYCTFREGTGHIPAETEGIGDGTIRILKSAKGEEWTSVALLTFKDIDLRDPKLSITPDNRLMISMGGSNYDGKTLVDREPYVSFMDSPKGTVTKPRPIVVDDTIGEDPGWLWRVTWHIGVGYGVSYRSIQNELWEVLLVKTTDGIHYTLVDMLELPGRPNESTVRFDKQGKMFIVVRNEDKERRGHIGHSIAPYTDWTWNDIPQKLGGPDMIFMPDGELLLGTRQYSSPTQTIVGHLCPKGSFTKYATFPSGGDTSYPGFVIYKRKLWMSYYASHEGKTSIYLATMKLKDIKERNTSLGH